MKALTFSEFGSADVMQLIDVADPKPQANEILIKNHAIGLNYADIYRRQGHYHLVGKPPYMAGYEGAGIVVESLSGQFKVGDLVAYADVPLANAEYTVVPETHAIPVPSDIGLKTSAALLLQGLTAQYLMEDSHKVQAGETVLIHAAAGGVGQLLTQMCHAAGAHVIGLTRNPDKLSIIKSCHASHAIELNDHWQEQVMALTQGQGVDVAYDSVGRTLKDSFAVTREGGHVVFYGMSAGDPDLVDPRMLMDTSKTLTGGDLWYHLNSQEARLERAASLFDRIRRGQLQLTQPVEFKLSQGKEAHQYLESGASASKVLLIPDAVAD